MISQLDQIIKPPEPIFPDTRGMGRDGASDGVAFKTAETAWVPASIGQPTPAKPSKPQHDTETTLRYCRKLFRKPGTVIELRVFGARFKDGYIVASDYKAALSGWFDNPEDLAVEISRTRGVSVYTTISPCDPDLLARSCNKLAKVASATKDDDVPSLRHLYLDIDPNRKADISSTDDELAAAMAKRDAILAAHPELAPASDSGSSGNGSFVLADIGDLPNTPENRELVAEATRLLAAQHDDARVKIDQKTKNPARVGPVPGSIKSKGSHIANRPWRNVTWDHEAQPGCTLDLAAFVAKLAAQTGEAAQSSRKRAASPATSKRPSGSPDASRPTVGGSGNHESKTYRASLYLATKEPAVSGQGGHARTFDAACVLVKGFGLSP